MYYSLNVDANSVKMFESAGVNLELLLRDAGIPPRATLIDKFQLTAEQYKGLAISMDKHISEEFILPISKVDSIPTFIPEFFAGLCADCGMTCIQRISKYKKIIAPIYMKVTVGEDTTSVTYVYNDGDRLPKMMLLNAQISLLSIIRKGTGLEDLLPVRIEGPYDYPKNAMDYIGLLPSRATDNAIVFRNTDLQRPFITENNKMFDYLESELNQRLRERETDQSFAAVVRKTLFEMIPGGVSDADKIASELGVSKRTLQRKLRDEKTSFNEQLNHTRELMVRNYLKMDMNLDEIAFLINYSDAKSLSRAFRVWTGKSISEYKLEQA